MNCKTMLLLGCLALTSLMGIAFAEERWDLMTRQETGVDRFLEQYPDFDGKGVVIAVLDTGVDMGVEGLKLLPDGTPKVVDVRDFTGEGDLFWKEGILVPDGDDGEKLMDAEGRSVRGFREAAEGASPERYYLAFLEESKFAETSVPDLNGDGDSKDSFAILIFAVQEEVAEEEAKEGEEDEEAKEKKTRMRYEAVVDLNGDGNLDDGQRLSDYWREQEYFVLKGLKGDRAQLGMGLNFFPEEQRLSVHFDDGGHGTHVAGIAAGYKIHGQEGYHGMAPGARVISLKIGNNRYAGGSTVTESVKKALDYGVKYAKDNKVPVVYNMSFGIGSERETDSAIDKYVDDLLWKNPGVVFVTSAGNEGPGLSSVGTPAAATRGITVGALLSPEAAAAQYGCQIDREIAFSFSSRGGDTFKPDIMAPGSAASTVPLWGDRDHMNGTSMASPAAAGTIALLVDGLVRHDPAYEIDNALVMRAVKNTGRDLPHLTLCDEGGGVLDLPAAYDYAAFLCEQEEGKTLREYRISTRGPAPGHGVAYWRISPVLPRKTDVMNFSIQAGYAEGITDEAKARFYRAFDLVIEDNWLSLTKPEIYLKGGQSTSVGIMADISNKAPGLHSARVKAFRKSPDRINDEPIHEFDLVVNVLIPQRVTPENRGRIESQGTIKPGGEHRTFVEVPYGATAMAVDLRMLDGERAAFVSVSVYDPEGVGQYRLGPVSDGQTRSVQRTFMGKNLVPGTWELVATSSMRSRAEASFDVTASIYGVGFDPPRFFGCTDGPTRNKVLIPVRCTQPLPFNGNVTARIDGLVKERVIEVKDSDEFTYEVQLDNSTGMATWTVDFDRETYALFTDCVLQIIDPETDKVVVNSGLGQRSGSVSITVAKKHTSPKTFKIRLLPGFSLAKDKADWRFTFTEKLTWASGPVTLEPIEPKGGRLSLMPADFDDLVFRMPAQLPAAPAGYQLNIKVEASTGTVKTIARKTFGL